MQARCTGKQSAEDLALQKMQVVLIEVPLRPSIIDKEEHLVRNRCLLFVLRLLVDKAATDLSLGRGC
jgi:hypothetical protein